MIDLRQEVVSIGGILELMVEREDLVWRYWRWRLLTGSKLVYLSNELLAFLLW